MQRCLMAGITPGEFWDLCFEETLLLINGYYDRVNAEWQQTRLIVYTIACTVTEPDKRQHIFDFLPLKGDPTPEEREAAALRGYERMKKEHEAFNESLRNELKKEKAVVK